MLRKVGEAGPGNEPSAARTFFEANSRQAEGDLTLAVSAIGDQPSALYFAYGYADKLAEEGVESDEAHKHVAARIHGHLRDGCNGDMAELAGKHEMWQPVLDAINVQKQKAHHWLKVVDTVHFLDEAGHQFLRDA